MDRREKSYKGCFWSLVLAIMTIAIVVLTLFSCTTEKMVTVEKVRTDTTYITKWQRDSVWLHDSIYVSEKGDTIRIERWHTKYMEKQVHDTIFVATHDTIPKPYPVIEEVPAELSWWQNIRIWIGNIFLMAMAAGSACLGWRIWRMRKII